MNSLADTHNWVNGGTWLHRAPHPHQTNVTPPDSTHFSTLTNDDPLRPPHPGKGGAYLG